jgi:uncharacterized protein (TIGR03083 family)
MDFLHWIDVESERLATAAGAGLDAPVPPCPGWTVRDAVEHTAEVYWHKVMCMRLGRFPESHEWPHGPGDDEGSVGWFRSAHAALAAELRARDPAEKSPTWWPPDQTTGFWRRRMAQEVAIHRGDVESAFGPLTPIDDALATDGVDEVLRRFLFNPYDERPAFVGDRSVAIVTGGRRWVVRMVADDAGFIESDDAADVEISGDPNAVDLWLWRRAHDDSVTITGDAATVAGFRDWLYVATQ